MKLRIIVLIATVLTGVWLIGPVVAESPSRDVSVTGVFNCEVEFRRGQPENMICELELD